MGLDLLKLAGEFARADQQSKKERIQEAGQDINEKQLGEFNLGSIF